MMFCTPCGRLGGFFFLILSPISALNNVTSRNTEVMCSYEYLNQDEFAIYVRRKKKEAN